MTRFPNPPAAPRSATSHAAAASIRPHAPSQRRRVHEYVAANPCCTRDQIAIALGLSIQSATPRVKELLTAGYVRVVDHAGQSQTGRSVERLMITAKPFSESPPRPAVQRTLPGLDHTEGT